MPKTIAVTGVASGIGAELVDVLTAQGHRIVGFDLVPPKRDLFQFIPLDLNDPASIEEAARRAPAALDGLCNNAGIPPRGDNAAAVLQINFLGQRQFTSAMIPHLASGASIVNMASRAGSKWGESVDQNKRLAATGTDGLADFIASEAIDATRAYNLSKEAMILWTMSLTDDLIAKGMRANSVSPGAVATGILDDFARAFGDKVATNMARAGRAAQAREVAELAAFLLSDASTWIKGTDIPIDGGMGGFNTSDALGLGAMKGKS